MTSLKRRALAALQRERQKQALTALGPEFTERNRLAQAYGRKALTVKWFRRLSVRL
jgi:hypothetical protein